MLIRFTFLAFGLATTFCTVANTSAQGDIDFRNAMQATSPATVAIVLGDQPGFSFPSRFGGLHAPAIPPIPNNGHMAFSLRQGFSSMRSGFAVATDLVVSCDLPRDAKEVTLRTSDGTELSGTVVVRDHVTGLSAVRVEDADLTPIVLGTQRLESGVPVLVTWLKHTKVATGKRSMIASETQAIRPTIGFTSTLDMDFDPAKVGASVVDHRGVLAGVLAGDPSNVLCLPVEHVNRLIEAANADQPNDLNRGRLGVQLNQDGGPSTIVSIMDETPAAKSELEPGDIFKKIGEYVCRNSGDVLAAVSMARAGDTLEIEIQRGDETLARTLELTPVKVPALATIQPESMEQQRYALKDGKLVPIGPRQLDPTKPDPRFARPVFPMTPNGLPRQLEMQVLGNFRVERSNLEASLKQLEGEKKKQDETIDRLREQISQLEADSMSRLRESRKINVDRLDEIVDEIKERLKREEK